MLSRVLFLVINLTVMGNFSRNSVFTTKFG